MVQIFDSLKALIEPELSKAAAAVGESESKVSHAASGILSGILAKLADKGATTQVDSALKEGGKTNILSHLGSIFSGNGTSEQEGPGNKLIRAILGDNAGGFTAAVAKESGISQNSANKLTTMIGTAAAGFLGSTLANGNLKVSDLMNNLGKEKSRFMGMVPAGLKNALGLNAAHRTQEKKKEKGKNNWLIWLILAIVLLLLIIFGWRSCRDKKDAVVEEAIVVEHIIPTPAPAPDRSLFEITLPNGVKLNIFRNGMEQKMIDFLNSDTYKNAKTDADLRNSWFEFEDVDFARDSASELSAGSQTRLANIAAILKAYPDAKIRIGGNADKSGHTEYNMEISKERADYIKSVLAGLGIDRSRIVTEGFGGEHASFPASASAAESASDRDIAFRFTK